MRRPLRVASVLLLCVVVVALPHAYAEDAPTVDALLATLQSEDGAARIAAIRALASRWDAKDRAAPKLVEHFARTKDVKERGQVLRTLVHLPSAASRKALVDVAVGDQLEMLAGVFDPAYRRDVLTALVVKLPGSLKALKRLTGQDFQLDRVAWQIWIRKQPPVSSAREGGVPAPKKSAEETGPTFFGLTVSRSDVVLLLDCSASMKEGGLLDRVKHAATAVVRSMRPPDRFGVVFFANQAHALRKRMITADSDTRDAAAYFIQRQKAGGGTNLAAGLDAALRDERVKEIVLFSDGLPNRGNVRTAHDALRRLRGRKVRVHVVVAGPGSATAFFALARKTGGRTIVASHAR